MTLILDLHLDIQKMQLHTKNKVTRLRLSKVRAQTAHTNNQRLVVEGRHRGPKQKLQAGYRALSLQWMCYVPSVILLPI